MPTSSAVAGRPALQRTLLLQLCVQALGVEGAQWWDSRASHRRFTYWAAGCRV